MGEKAKEKNTNTHFVEQDNNEKMSIHEFDINIIIDYFSKLDRQGPGSSETTIKALGFIDNLSEKSCIADIGCGTGGQTMVLAQHTVGTIVGIDLFPAMIDKFNENARKANLHNRVKGNIGSMDNLNFKNEELDMIWSEGAIYNIGFDRGLKEWNKYLKCGGYIAVTDATWFTENRPDEITDFWLEAYKEIDTIPNNMLKMQKAGYIPKASFIIPENCWTENFYVPQVPLQEYFLEKHTGNKSVEGFIANQRHEAKMYEKYRKYYGYVFYIGKKI